MTVRVGGSGQALARRRARRLGVVLGGSSIAWNLVLAAVPAAAVAPMVPAAPKYADAICDPTVGSCVTDPIAGDTDVFRVTAVGGTREAVLAAIVNNDQPPLPRPDCPGLDEGDSDVIQIGFKDLRLGSTWTKGVEMTSTRATTQQVAVAAARRDLTCFQAPYRFFVRPGFRIDPGPQERGPYTGVLASCSTVDSLFPTEFRNRVQPLPCVLLRRVVAFGSGWVVQTVVRIPRDAAVTRLLHTN